MKTNLFTSARIFASAGIIAFFAFATLSCTAQTLLLPNGDFESWAAGYPNQWLGPSNPNIATVTEVTGNGGGSAARCEVIDSSSSIFDVCRLVNMGDGDFTFPVDQNYDSLVFDYQFHNEDVDYLFAMMSCTDIDTNDVAFATFFVTNEVTTWTTATVAIPDTSGGTATDCQVVFFLFSNGGTGDWPATGSYFMLDNVRLTNDPTGIMEHPNNPVVQATVFPNPTTGIFTIESSENISAIEIMNLNGEKVYSEKMLNAKSEILNLDIPNGIYFLEITTEQGIAMKKIIIEK